MSFNLIVIVLLAGAGDVPASQPASRPAQQAATQPATRPDPLSALPSMPTINDMAPPGRLGFALYRIFMRPPLRHHDDYASIERDMLIELYDAEMKSIGIFHRGDALPKPFQDWRIVGIPLGVDRPAGNYPPRIIITNMTTKETVELVQSRLAQELDR